MKLKSIIDDINIPDNGIYNSEEWYIFIQGILKYILKYSHGERELFDDLYVENPDTLYWKILDRDVIINKVKEYINACFVMNNFRYRKLYEALFADFNPLWNVDGVETLTYVKDNTGTQGNIGSNTGTQTSVRTGSDAIAHTGAITNSESGIESTAHTGTQTNTLPEKTTTDYNTTFDSTTEYETHKSVESYNVQTTTRTDNLTDTHTAGITNTETHTDTDTHTYNSLQDQRTDNLANSNTRTDNLKEEYSEIKERHGNIGVTKSTDLVMSAADVRNDPRYDLAQIISCDIIEYICYS